MSAHATDNLRFARIICVKNQIVSQSVFAVSASMILLGCRSHAAPTSSFGEQLFHNGWQWGHAYHNTDGRSNPHLSFSHSLHAISSLPLPLSLLFLFFPLSLSLSLSLCALSACCSNVCRLVVGRRGIGAGWGRRKVPCAQKACSKSFLRSKRPKRRLRSRVGPSNSAVIFRRRWIVALAWVGKGVLTQ